MSRVFVSYGQESSDHNDRVAGLVSRLRASGFQVSFDRDQPAGGPPRGWAAWSEREILTADKVLVVCSEKYGRSYDGNQPGGRGRGSIWEAGVIRSMLYEAGGLNERVRAAVFDPAAEAFVPWALRGPQVFRISDPHGCSELMAWLSAAPGVSPAVSITEPDEPGLPLPADIAAEPIFAEWKARIAGLRGADEIEQTADDYFRVGMGPEALHAYRALEEAAVRGSDFRRYAYANERIGAVYWRAGDRARARRCWATSLSVYSERFREELPLLTARIEAVTRVKPGLSRSR